MTEWLPEHQIEPNTPKQYSASEGMMETMTDSKQSDRTTGDPVAATSGMDVELKRKWVEALWSGKYEQGQIHLKFEDRYCCLGVLCDVAGQPISVEARVEGNTAKRVDYAFIEDALGARDLVNVLTRLNDCERKSFSQIADYIEANIPVRA